MKTCGAYVLIEIHSGKCYFGSSDDLDERVKTHLRHLRRDVHHNKLLQSEWKNGGQFETQLWPTATREEAYAQELALITEFAAKEPQLLLNVSLGVRGGDGLTRNPDREAIVNRMSENASGVKNGMFGRTHSNEVKAKLSDFQRGNSYALGAVRSPEMRARLSEYAKTRTGESNPFFGRRHSEETKQRISAVKKTAYQENGQLPPNSRQVNVNGVVYESLSEAARQIGISAPLMLHRLQSRNEKYAGYNYVI